MRVLTRNKQTIFYQLYEGVSDVLDGDGNLTGDKEVTYSEKTPLRANVYMGNDPTLYQPYGNADETICTLYLDRDHGMDTQTILWIRNIKYIVTSVSNNLNGTTVKAKMLK